MSKLSLTGPCAVRPYRVALDERGNAEVLDTIASLPKVTVAMITLEGAETIVLPRRPQADTKPTLLKRLSLAWDVFVGRADALYWDKQ